MPSDSILIVEDDRDLGRAVATRLKLEGYRPIVAQDAYHAKRLARLESPALIILDLQLPAGDGFGVHEDINNMPQGVVPVIYVTGSARDDLEEKARSLGAHGVFRKPLDMAAFLEAVRTCVPQEGSVNKAAAVSGGSK